MCTCTYRNLSESNTGEDKEPGRCQRKWRWRKAWLTAFELGLGPATSSRSQSRNSEFLANTKPTSEILLEILGRGLALNMSIWVFEF